MTQTPALKPGDKVVRFGEAYRDDSGLHIGDDGGLKPDPTPILRDLSREGGTGAGTYTAEDGEMHCVYCHGVMRIHPLAPGQSGITYEHELGCPIVRARAWLEGR